MFRDCSFYECLLLLSAMLIFVWIPGWAWPEDMHAKTCRTPSWCQVENHGNPVRHESSEILYESKIGFLLFVIQVLRIPNFYMHSFCFWFIKALVSFVSIILLSQIFCNRKKLTWILNFYKKKALLENAHFMTPVHELARCISLKLLYRWKMTKNDYNLSHTLPSQDINARHGSKAG